VQISLPTFTPEVGLADGVLTVTAEALVFQKTVLGDLTHNVTTTERAAPNSSPPADPQRQHLGMARSLVLVKLMPGVQPPPTARS
jgi:hypothetical protein